MGGKGKGAHGSDEDWGGGNMIDEDWKKEEEEEEEYRLEKGEFCRRASPLDVPLENCNGKRRGNLSLNADKRREL